jgi:hypothetical protein
VKLGTNDALGGHPTQLERLDVLGAINIGAASRQDEGTIQYVAGHFQGHNATAWVNLDDAGGGGGGGLWTDDAGNGMLLPVPTTRSLQLDASAAVHFGNPLGGAARVAGDGTGVLFLHGQDGTSIVFDIGGSNVGTIDAGSFTLPIPVYAPNIGAPPTSLMNGSWTNDISLTSVGSIIGETMSFSPSSVGLSGKTIAVRATVLFEIVNSNASVLGTTLYVRLAVRKAGVDFHAAYMGMIVSVAASSTRQFTMPFTLGALLDDPSAYFTVEVKCWWANDAGATCKQKTTALEVIQ